MASFPKGRQYARRRRPGKPAGSRGGAARARRGGGVVTVSSRGKPKHNRDSNEGHTRDHTDGRENRRGSGRARRYVAVRGSPKYLATYECDRVGDLAAPGYLAVLAHQ